MRQAFFITGFNNWGKSTIIADLFGNRQRFQYGYQYPISGVNFSTLFTVQSQSNDDLGAAYVDRIVQRIKAAPDGGQYLFSALCPSMEPSNNFIQILSSPPFTGYDKLYVFLLEYKWEHHAKLIIDNIVAAGRVVPNVTFITINADRAITDVSQRHAARMQQIRNELNNIFGTP